MKQRRLKKVIRGDPVDRSEPVHLPPCPEGRQGGAGSEDGGKDGSGEGEGEREEAAEKEEGMAGEIGPGEGGDEGGEGDGVGGWEGLEEQGGVGEEGGAGVGGDEGGGKDGVVGAAGLEEGGVGLARRRGGQGKAAREEVAMEAGKGMRRSACDHFWGWNRRVGNPKPSSKCGPEHDSS